MESLALLVVWLFIFTHLCGPLALVLSFSVYWLNLWMAVLIGCLAVFLGVHWFTGVYTWPRYLGLVSAGFGIFAVYKAIKKLF